MRFFDTYFDKNQEFRALTIIRFVFESDVVRYRKNTNFLEISNP